MLRNCDISWVSLYVCFQIKTLALVSIGKFLYGISETGKVMLVFHLGERIIPDLRRFNVNFDMMSGHCCNVVSTLLQQLGFAMQWY